MDFLLVKIKEKLEIESLVSGELLTREYAH